MKSYRQQKRKRGDINRNQDECMGINLKKPANETGRGPLSSLENIMMPHLDPPIQLQIPSRKIKLQLFPINGQTRLGLEKDGHNPFLELTLSARKRISSVVRHLDAKWSSSTAVTGQLMLFPYNTKLEQLASCRRWTLNDSAFTVWDVYVDVGSPSIFRLRYGWLCNHQPEIFGGLCNSSLLEAHTGFEDKGSPRNLVIPNHQEEQTNESCEVIKIQGNADETLRSDVNQLKASDAPTGLVDDKVTIEADLVHPGVPWDDNMTILSIGGLLSEISLQGKINESFPSSVSRSQVQPIALTSDMSIRDLLSEDSFLGKMRCSSMKLENESSLQPLFLGSSDVSIGGLFSEASLLAKLKKSDTQSAEVGHAPFQSPWDDNFTTLSIGGLLSEASLQAKTGGKVESKESKTSLEPLAPSRSLEIAAQLYAPSQRPKLSMHEPNLSILDAEETCHAFPIQRLQSNRDVTTSNARVGSGGCSNVASSKQSQIARAAKTINGTVFPKDSSREGLETDLLACPVKAFDEDSRLWPFGHRSAGAG
ncbi:TSL-kinase interacting protein 1 isoform X2 [Salvia miltiorrhiza]|uniref:TSL-kinase interacting protein 1 isoform X2 n=1 Tax=Salvia miltiorrhiza TaxID=226208 RepID=UPI0025AD2B97|nr:TSL-kinase interacting protein 1 isoform X2 [Salvia miltiorrhiza]XP_057806954.1 TSL-kinase interacting protein 1 isoform X2 [Salvia miltiorrhiza]